MALLGDQRFPSDVESAHCEIKAAGLKDESSSRVPEQGESSTGRVLSPEELHRLADERTLVSDFKQLKLEREAQKNWDLFYKRNSTHFFKDRHWTTREFEELKACREVMLSPCQTLSLEKLLHAQMLTQRERRFLLRTHRVVVLVAVHSLSPRSWCCWRPAVESGTASSLCCRRTATSSSTPATSLLALLTLSRLQSI